MDAEGGGRLIYYDFGECLDCLLQATPGSTAGSTAGPRLSLSYVVPALPVR